MNTNDGDSSRLLLLAIRFFGLSGSVRNTFRPTEQEMHFASWRIHRSQGVESTVSLLAHEEKCLTFYSGILTARAKACRYNEHLATKNVPQFCGRSRAGIARKSRIGFWRIL